jgi:hypothetical protein
MVIFMKNNDNKLNNYKKPQIKIYGNIKKNTKAATGQGSRDAIYSGRPH